MPAPQPTSMPAPQPTSMPAPQPDPTPTGTMGGLIGHSGQALENAGSVSEGPNQGLEVWFLGSSIIKRAGIAARSRPGGLNLGLQRMGANIFWQGYGGLGIQQVESKISLLQSVAENPNILLLHCGGNDLGKIPIAKLRSVFRRVIRFLYSQFPGVKLIFSQILPRLSYRYSDNVTAMEACRCRLNSAVAKDVLGLGGCYLKYPDIKATEAFFSQDKVHLSELGNNIFLNTLQGGVEYFARGEGGPVFPE
ncbi:uncharacterized protein [Argopecten irradians]|uniref:uncharacterized protein n=1 Tax=Argopecten irradians TaxID=31199 RepID=UPI00371DED5D